MRQSLCMFRIILTVQHSYKQNKFNLLREESEGYSKLTAELTSSLGPSHSSSTGYPSEPIEVIEARALPTWERALGLIGYFDLDPNRVLDILLDIFSVHLATHSSFFISLLSFSPWGRREQRGVKREDMVVEPDAGRFKGKSLFEVLKIAEAESGAHLDDVDSSNARVLAQVLGFKFTYYQVSICMRLCVPSINLFEAPRGCRVYATESLSNDRHPHPRGFPPPRGFVPSCRWIGLYLQDHRSLQARYRLALRTMK